MTGLLTSQSSHFRRGHKVYHHIDRLDAIYGVDSSFHTSDKYYQRDRVFDLMSNLDYAALSKKDQNENDYFRKDTIATNQKKGPGLFKSLYRNPAHLFSHKSENFSFVVNPILHFSLGDSDSFIFQNTRGLELYGDLDGKFYFYSNFFENQSNFLNYIQPYIDEYQAIPGQGNYKDYESSIINAFQGFDYSNAQAYLGYSLSKHSIIELGHGKHFLGNGIRSLLLGDNGQNYFYLKFRINVWRLYYRTIFAELASVSARYNPGNSLLSKKYMANHYLGFKVGNKLELGLFESVVFSRENHFEFQYLNPVILYRSVEHIIDSPDNVLIGLNLKWNFNQGMSFYSQLILDELRTDQIFSGDGWWGNKYGIQLGLKYFNFLNIDQLDLQFEFNRVRPYTYSHWNPIEQFPLLSVASYSHYNQALAHPLDSNFTEFLFDLKYPVTDKFDVHLQLLHTKVGRNRVNDGSDILLVNTSRSSDFGNRMHQGNKSTINQLNLLLSYELFSYLSKII